MYNRPLIPEQWTLTFTQRPTHPHTNVIVALFIIVKSCKQPKCPTTGWMVKQTGISGPYDPTEQ